MEPGQADVGHASLIDVVVREALDLGEAIQTVRPVMFGVVPSDWNRITFEKGEVIKLFLLL